MKMRALLLLLVGCSGCTNGAMFDPDGGGVTGDGGIDLGAILGKGKLDVYQSGTRLKMRVLTTPDGAKNFNGWYDTQQNINCGFARAYDDVMRCLPTTNQPVAGLFWYSGCTVMLAYTSQISPCSNNNIAVWGQSVSTCVGGSQYLYRIYNATPTTINQQLYQGAGPSSCTAISTPTTLNFFTVGAEIDPTTYVSATESLE